MNTKDQTKDQTRDEQSFKGTPGPWHILEGNYSQDGPVTTINKNTSCRICRLDFGRGHAPRAEQEANAQLIAAAPDLLVAAQELYGLLRFYEAELAGHLSEDEEVLITHARQAIRRALGQAE